ncbi:MAG: LTA synthase family protein [Bacillota bacterium]|nr:LTA synthase family protein [Bacillota bacterium]
MKKNKKNGAKKNSAGIDANRKPAKKVSVKKRSANGKNGSGSRRIGLSERLLHFLRERRFQVWQGYLFLFLFCVALTFLEFAYSVGSLGTFLKNLQRSPLIFLLNLFPISAGVFFLYFLTSSLRFSTIVNFIFFNVIFIVNRIKILYRNEPLYISDLRLGAESIAITKGESYSPGSAVLLLSGAAFVLLLFVVFYFKSAKIGWKSRVIGGIATVLISWSMFANVYPNQALYARILPDVSMYNDSDSSENKGILYYLLYSVQFSKVAIPDGYNKNEFSGTEHGQIEMTVKPNILMIMGEAYFDLSDLEIFSFPNRRPTHHFDRLSRDALVTGRIWVPAFGGGTADTEFDVLTGCLTIKCAPNGTFSFNSILDDTGSVARVLKNRGYHTRAFHPGYNFFYKRQTVYPRLGFDEVLFIDSVENQIFVGRNLQEKQTFDEYTGRLLRHLDAEERPIFDYMVTIQNHGPYYAGKFNADYAFECEVPLHDEVRSCIASYFQGVHEMDEELGRLADLVEELPEPFLLVFYGDHLPSLYGGNYSYDQIGMDIVSGDFDAEKRRHTTPYLIWANRSYREMLEKQYGSDKIPPEINRENVSLITSNYLGGLVLQVAGAAQADEFFVELNALRANYPVISSKFIYDGKTFFLTDEVNADALGRYYRYQYYRIND